MNHVLSSRKSNCELNLFGGARDLTNFLVKFSPVISSFVDLTGKTAHNDEGGQISRAILPSDMKRKTYLLNSAGMKVIIQIIEGTIYEHYAKDEPVI